MSLGHGASIVRNGLIFHLDAANVKSYPGSGTSLKDLSTSSNNGTLLNGPTFSSSNSGVLVFDGVNDYLLTSNATIADNLPAMTVSCWVKTNWLTGGTYSPLIEKFPDETAGSGWELALNWFGTPGIFVMLQDTGGAHWNSELVPAGGLLVSGTYWLNVSFSYSGGVNSKLLIYINGVQQTTTSKGSGVVGNISTTSKISVASRDGVNTYGTNFSSMTLGDVKIYNRQLTASEIVKNFEALRGRYGI